MNKYFVYDPDGEGLETFATIEERDKAAEEIIDIYKEDGEWCDSVMDIITGVIAKKSKQGNCVYRPDVLDSNGCDENGNYWPKGIRFMCDFKMTAI